MLSATSVVLPGLLCLKHLWDYIIIRYWHILLHHHWKVSRFYYQHVMGTRVTVLKISLTCIRLAAEDMTYSQRCFRQIFSCTHIGNCFGFRHRVVWWKVTNISDEMATSIISVPNDIFWFEIWGSRSLQNIGNILPDYMESHHRRLFFCGFITQWCCHGDYIVSHD
jgi:hypothetical protein